MTNSESIPPDGQQQKLDKARISLRQSLERVSTTPQLGREQLAKTLAKLDQGTYSIAVFGLVSRGKSAVLNALVGEKILETGPLNGVTRFPRSIRWQVNDHIEVDLIDTPGLDEVDGEERGKMAREITRQVDLILFIIAGDITQIEYQSLCELRNAQKPIILVFNKADLYPESTRLDIYQQLQNLGNNGNTHSGQLLQKLLSAEEVVMIAAEPSPIKVRIENSDGTVTYQWEKPEPNILPLKDKIRNLLETEGTSLLAINALVQAREVDNSHAVSTLGTLKAKAESLIWQFAQYKALAIALNPIPLFDVLGGLLTDLILIRSLAKLYNLPLTNYEITKLWGGIIFSTGSLILAELFTSLVFEVGINPPSLINYGIGAIIQGVVSGYGSFRVGEVSAIYLLQGCSWGEFGSNRLIQEIFQEVPKETIVSRLEEELAIKLQS